MNIEKNYLYNGVRLIEGKLSSVPHVVSFADFNTNYPNPNRINRIASEINEYLKYETIKES